MRTICLIFLKFSESQMMERQTEVINIFQFFGKGVGKMKKYTLPVLENNLPPRACDKEQIIPNLRRKE